MIEKCMRCTGNLKPHKTVDEAWKCDICGALYTEGVVKELLEVEENGK